MFREIQDRFYDGYNFMWNIHMEKMLISQTHGNSENALPNAKDCVIVQLIPLAPKF